MRYEKAKTTKAFAIARRDEIMLDALEPWTDDGRQELIRRINRAAGERVVTVRVTEIDH
jgi:hypothetical protein